MNTLDKLFNAIKTAPSQRMKEYATKELIRQLSEFEDHVLFILRSVYQLLTSEASESRICGAKILRFMKMFKYEGTLELKVAATEHVYLQAKDILDGEGTMNVGKQKIGLIKKLKLDHVDHRFLDRMVGDGEDNKGSFRLNTVDIEEKKIDNVYSFYEAINVLIFSPDWYKRHGALLAYGSIFKRIEDRDYDKDIIDGNDDIIDGNDDIIDGNTTNSIHIKLNPNIFSKVYEILKNDKFSDFIDNQTSAPVREAAAVLLRQLYGYLNGRRVIEIFIGFLDSKDWQEQFSGLIALLELKKYLKHEKGLCDVIVLKLVELLESLDEDVKYMSAELLNYIIVNIDSNDSVIVNNDNNMVSSNMASSNMANNNMASSNMVNNNITSNDKIISKILEICWRQIEDETDIAHSKASFLVLIKNIYTIHNRSLPSDISSLYPCFTSPVKIIRDSVVDLCRIFKNEESLYLLGESILLADDTEQARRTCEVLAECVENTEKFEGLSDFFSHFFRIISLNIYAPYKEDDFACFNDNFFTKDGIQSIGYDFILRNRLFLFKILEKIENRNVLEVKTVLGLTFTGLLEYKLSSSLSSKLQGNILQDCSLQSNYKDLQGNCVLSMELQGNDNSKGNYKDLQGNDKDNGKNNGNNDKDKDRDLRTHLLNNIQSDFNRYPFLKRMSIDEFKSIISNPSYKSLLLLANERTVDYVRMIVTNNLNIPDISIYYQLETSIEALRLITKYKISIGIDSLLIKNMYNLLVEEAIKISENEELNNCKTKNNYENNLSRPLENYCIFFEELGSLIFNENIIDFIMNDKNRLIFFELTIRYYITDNIIENDVLNILFNQALAIGNIQILKYFIRNLHYNQLLVKNLLIDFKPAVFYELLDYSDPSFNPLFVGLALRNPFPGLLSKIIPSLYFIPNENIGNDLLQLINSKRSELSMLVDPTKIPEYSVDCNVSIELRDYQKEGIRWMAFLNKFGLNGILADDMGLGKTIQVLTYLVNEMNKCNHKDSINDKGDSIDSIKSLIICPGSLTFHWSNELKTYFNLDSQIYNNKIKTLSSNIIIATYDNIRRDTGILTNRKWFMVIFDEGHLLKSRTTQLYNKSMLLVSTYKFILTGTPIHNSVDDLFSLFNLIMPGYLGTESSFSANYMVKITEKNVDVMENRLELLHKKVLPFIMRRLKTDVLKDLPPKIIKDVSVELSQEHMEIYKNVSSGAIGGETVGEKQNISADVEKSQLNYQHLKNSGSLLLTRSMLKAASHPHHFDSTVPSSKTAVLKEILSMCGERKVLIFFQLKKTIDFVIEELGIVNYLRLDGTLPATQRGSVVSRFNSESVQYLFLTTSIGGLGLNLVSADTVIFYEHDWNPFNDLQAMDRAHRLGQKRVVNVFRLISKDTIEEKVMNYQNFKVFVASSIVTQQNTGIEKMDTKDLLERFE